MRRSCKLLRVSCEVEHDVGEEEGEEHKTNHVEQSEDIFRRISARAPAARVRDIVRRLLARIASSRTRPWSVPLSLSSDIFVSVRETHRASLVVRCAPSSFAAFAATFRVPFSPELSAICLLLLLIMMRYTCAQP